MNPWQPSASLSHLKIRARILKQIRDFFNARGVLEVETPLMCHTSVTDPFIESIPALFKAHPHEKELRYYLQTSPEYAMKRLLAAGCGAIYQITKSFRQGEVGRLHNPEFTMIEWYQPGFDHHALMNEMDELLQLILETPRAKRLSYADMFQTYLMIDVNTASIDDLKTCALKENIQLAGDLYNRDSWLIFLMTHLIEPRFDHTQPFFIYDFPVSQAALARIQPGHPPTAARFEVYFRGIELANGFYELQDAHEQRKRFENNLEERKALGLNTLPIDELFLDALMHGLPDCSGVALGLDRLVMLATKCTNIADILSFDFSRV